MSKTIVLLPGDGIGPEIVAEAGRIIEHFRSQGLFDVQVESALIGGAAYEATGHSLPVETLELARRADAILLGAVGGPQWDAVPRDRRPETALLTLRSELDLFANLRPAITYPQLADASSLKPELVAGLDILIVRELTGGIYFGKPRGIETGDDGIRRGFNTLVYSEPEIERIVKLAFEAAARRGSRICSVDKANVLECSELWREVASRVARDHPDCELTHMYVDNAAMQLVRAPKQFDVIVTSNMFGDILSDAAAMLTGSIGMLPSASLNARGAGLYEPVHGSAPDLVGTGKANPLATILSLAMMLRYSFARGDLADLVEQAVSEVLDSGIRTADIAGADGPTATTQEVGRAVVAALEAG